MRHIDRRIEPSLRRALTKSVPVSVNSPGLPPPPAAPGSGNTQRTGQASFPTRLASGRLRITGATLYLRVRPAKHTVGSLPLETLTLGTLTLTADSVVLSLLNRPPPRAVPPKPPLPSATPLPAPPAPPVATLPASVALSSDREPPSRIAPPCPRPGAFPSPLCVAAHQTCAARPHRSRAPTGRGAWQMGVSRCRGRAKKYSSLRQADSARELQALPAVSSTGAGGVVVRDWLSLARSIPRLGGPRV